MRNLHEVGTFCIVQQGFDTYLGLIAGKLIVGGHDHGRLPVQLLYKVYEVGYDSKLRWNGQQRSLWTLMVVTQELEIGRCFYLHHSSISMIDKIWYEDNE